MESNKRETTETYITSINQEGMSDDFFRQELTFKDHPDGVSRTKAKDAPYEVGDKVQVSKGVGGFLRVSLIHKPPQADPRQASIIRQSSLKVATEIAIHLHNSGEFHREALLENIKAITIELEQFVLEV